jgi:hypothetical protein
MHAAQRGDTRSELIRPALACSSDLVNGMQEGLLSWGVKRIESPPPEHEARVVQQTVRRAVTLAIVLGNDLVRSPPDAVQRHGGRAGFVGPLSTSRKARRLWRPG